MTIVLSVMGHCLSFAFFIWPLYCLLWVNVCPLSFSFDHCIFCYGSMFVLCFFSFDHCIVCYGSLFVLCLFHLTIVFSVMGQCLSFVFFHLTIVLSVMGQCLSIFFFIWPLYCLLWVILCPLSFAFDHCIVCYGSLFFFVLYIWPLYCLLWVNVCPLPFSFDHCIVCYGSMFVLCLFHLTIVLSVMGYCLSFFFFIWPLYCMLWVNVCSLSFSFDHCIVCYGSMFVLCLFHLTIVLSVMGQCLSFFFFIWPLYCMLWVIVCPFPFHLTIVLYVMGHCLSFVFFIWPLYCLLWVNVCPFSFLFNHCIVCYGSLFVLCLFHLTIV